MLDEVEREETRIVVSKLRIAARLLANMDTPFISHQLADGIDVISGARARLVRVQRAYDSRRRSSRIGM